MKKKLVATAIVALVTLGTGGAAVAEGDGDHDGRKGCNAGRGNGSETVLDNDCDPGNSGGRNNGGD